MKLFFKRIVLSTALLSIMCIANIANATIINDVTKNYFTDGVSGFDWLRATETDNESYNTVLTRVTTGDLQGWEFATLNELETLAGRFTAGPITDGWSFNNKGTENLIDTFGCLDDCNPDLKIVQLFTANVTVSTKHWASRFIYSTRRIPSGESPDLIRIIWANQRDTTELPRLASALRRRSVELDIPEPTPLIIFVMGILAFAIRRQKCNNATR